MHCLPQADVRFVVREAAWLPEHVRERLLRLFASRVNSKGGRVAVVVFTWLCVRGCGCVCVAVAVYPWLCVRGCGCVSVVVCT